MRYSRSRVVADLHDLILKLWKEEVDDLVLLDGQRVEVDLLHRLDLASLDETAKLGNWLPLLLLVLVGATAGTATSTSSITASAVSSTVCKEKSSAIRPVLRPVSLQLLRKRTTAGSETSSCCVGHVD